MDILFTESGFLWVVLIWLGVSGASFLYLLFVAAPYGRHQRSGWGIAIPARLGWVIMEAPAVFTILLFFLFAPSKQIAHFVFLAFWLVHYIHRTFIFPFRMRADGKTMPLIIAASGILFNIVNGYINGVSVFYLHAPYTKAWFYSPQFLIGAALFLTGWAINFHADNLLFKLRAPGETGYKIPEGGLYRFISCPNYFGEIIEWLGWAMLTWSLGGFVFFLWTTANLAPRAFKHHRWYKKTFPDYPKNRKVLVPFLL